MPTGREALSAILSMDHVGILGIGNRLRGDDGAGSILASELSGRCRHLSIDAGSTPENFTHHLSRERFHAILIIDTVDMGLKPGAWQMLRPDELGGIRHSPHEIPLPLFIDYVESSCATEVLVLGIQPERVTFGAGLSPAVRHAIDELIATCTEFSGGYTIKSLAV